MPLSPEVEKWFRETYGRDIAPGSAGLPPQEEVDPLTAITKAAVGPNAEFWPSRTHEGAPPPPPEAYQLNIPGDPFSAILAAAKPEWYEALSKPIPGANPEVPNPLAAMQNMAIAGAGAGQMRRANSANMGLNPAAGGKPVYEPGRAARERVRDNPNVQASTATSPGNRSVPKGPYSRPAGQPGAQTGVQQGGVRSALKSGHQTKTESSYGKPGSPKRMARASDALRRKPGPAGPSGALGPGGSLHTPKPSPPKAGPGGAGAAAKPPAGSQAPAGGSVTSFIQRLKDAGVDPEVIPQLVAEYYRPGKGV